MKSLVLLFVSLIMVISCNFIPNTEKIGKTETNEKKKDSIEESKGNRQDRKKAEEQAKKDCYQYLDQYKNWLFRYVKVRLEFEHNENNEEVTELYRELVKEGENLGDPNDFCSSFREFQDSLSRLDEIASKALKGGYFDENILKKSLVTD